MKRIAKFEKVSFEEFYKGVRDIDPTYKEWSDKTIKKIYDGIHTKNGLIKLLKRFMTVLNFQNVQQKEVPDMISLVHSQ